MIVKWAAHYTPAQRSDLAAVHPIMQQLWEQHGVSLFAWSYQYGTQADLISYTGSQRCRCMYKCKKHYHIYRKQPIKFRLPIHLPWRDLQCELLLPLAEHHCIQNKACSSLVHQRRCEFSWWLCMVLQHHALRFAHRRSVTGEIGWSELMQATCLGDSTHQTSHALRN